MTVSADKTRPVPSPRTEASDSGKDSGARAAAERVISGHSTNIELLGLRLQLPSPEGLAFVAGLGVLAAFGILDWPVAAVIAIGHGLAHSHRGRVLRDFGEALEQA
ncbi:hypothetical protein [Amycolatopsis taiwanensis]|uniref:Uncharacterized protein n=1 Tax=Amycolatopsis taiwanensis TaxID=342230 RepID=A0A9W6VBU0_9PSEU|nr:hypothetical protein [Amycolatopsis taiwanensis]GLY65363.1 hypothetical protein Atai01_19820 [Amycolatopsis taiwanensis]